MNPAPRFAFCRTGADDADLILTASAYAEGFGGQRERKDWPLTTDY